MRMIHRTAFYSILHLLVDGICALAMFGIFRTGGDGYRFFLFYNFCAFALKMPLGAALDLLGTQKNGTPGVRKWLPPLFVVLGVCMTAAGVLTNPVILGIGNALFHVGGSVGTIYEDEEKNWKGRGYGIFLAPGAMGLFIGTQLAKNGGVKPGLLTGAVFAFCLCAGLIVRLRMADEKDTPVLQARAEDSKAAISAILCLAGSCFLIEVLRSYIGMAVTFSWDSLPVLAFVSVLMVVAGKIAGGFLAAHFGIVKTGAAAFGGAAVCYLFKDVAPAGLLAVLLLNITVPLTLYLLVHTFHGLPGFAYGFSTFGLFLGFLPVFYEWKLPLSGMVFGAGSCILLLFLFLLGNANSCGLEIKNFFPKKRP